VNLKLSENETEKESFLRRNLCQGVTLISQTKIYLPIKNKISLLNFSFSLLLLWKAFLSL